MRQIQRSFENTVCSLDSCTGCMACINVCKKKAIRIIDNLTSYNAEIDSNACVNCKSCIRICPNNNKIILKQPILWKQGWASSSIRATSASGGAASAIIRSFILNGGYVASCVFSHGEFVFEITDDIDRAKLFAGSKYIKSNPKMIYRDIQKLINQGKKVLFIGLPCQSAAVQKICGNTSELYTVDLICHGTPSPRLLNKYLLEKHVDINNIDNIWFREKRKFETNNGGIRFVPRRVVDSYLLAFLKGVDYTENCYSCQYATINRVSDVTLGDAWGQLSDSVEEGVSLILCQSDKGKELIEKAELTLFDVDIDKAMDSNSQLRHPTEKHNKRDRFFRHIKKNHSFRLAALSAFPKDSIKQCMKSVLIRINIMKDTSGGGYRIVIFLGKSN